MLGGALTGPWTRTVRAEIDRLVAHVEVPGANSAALGVGNLCRQHLLVNGDLCRTSAGATMSELQGVDAVEFLLAMGVELSLGAEDPWRMSAGELRQLLEHQMDMPLQWTSPARMRLERMWNLGLGCEALYGKFELFDESRDLVHRVANEPDSRFRALARALIDLERGRVTVGATGRGTIDRSDMSYARSVAHEIRNLVLPLATSLDALWEELGRDTADVERRRALQERVGRAVGRLSEFATEAVRLSSALTEEEVALVEVVADAVRGTEVERNGRIAVEVGDLGRWTVRGTRRDWTMAFVNLLRNAGQVRAGKGTVWVTVATDALGGLHVHVDDDGPGVPEELRERVFDAGYSTRGGSGVGLAEGRRTALLAGGTLVCEASPRGGARFHFAFPHRSER